MIVKKSKGQICFKCGDFTKRFIKCECCKKVSCKSCSLNSYYCIDCYNKKYKTNEVDQYFKEKQLNSNFGGVIQ